MSTASTTWASAAIQIVAATRGTSNQSVATTTSCTSADATPGAKRRVLIGLPFNFGHSRCLKSSHHWSLKIKIHLNTVWFEFPAQHTICCWSTSFVRKYILRCSALGFKIALQEFLEMIEYRHSSVDLSVPTILPPQVWVLSTPSMLSSFKVKFVLYLSCEKNKNKQKRGLCLAYLKIIRNVDY